MEKIRISLACLLLMLMLPAAAQKAISPIRVNQLGYYPEAAKIAIVIVPAGTPAQRFYILKLNRQDTL